MDNRVKYYFHTVLMSLIVMMLSGSVLQTVLIENGIGENGVNVFLSFMQIVQVAAILGFMRFSDSVKKVIKVSAWTAVLFLPLTAMLTFITLFQKGVVMNVLLYFFGIVMNVSVGVYNVLSYKLPYHIMPMTLYGKILSRGGMLIGIVCALYSVFISFLQMKAGYYQAMRILYIFTMLFIMGYVIATLRFKEIAFKADTEQTERVNILRYKPFTRLVVPNLLRGFSLGTINIAVTVGYYIGVLDVESAGITVIITNVMTVIGCMAYSITVNKVPDKRILLLTSIFAAVFMVLSVFGGTKGFLVFYAIAFFFVTVINYAVPVAVTKIVDYSVMGQYSAGRMLLNTVGTAVAGFVCVPLIDLIGALGLMIVAGSAQILSGIGYYIYMCLTEAEK